MTKYRYSVLVKDEAKTSDLTSGTETKNLSKTGILTELTLQARYKGSYVDNQNVPMYLALKKVEVLVNGSTVIKSLSGTQIRALMWYNKGPFSTTNNYLSQFNHEVYYQMFTLYFGAFAGDDLRGLDLTKYNNPQIQFEWDLATTSHNGITYDANTTDPTFTFNIMEKIMDEKPAGFLDEFVLSKQIDIWTTANSAEHRVEVPIGERLFRLMMGCRYVSLSSYDFFDKVVFDLDNGKWKPIDMDWPNIVALHKQAWPEDVVYNGYVSLANSDNFDAQVMYINSVGMSTVGGNISTIKFPMLAIPLYVVTVVDYAGAAITSTSAFQFSVHGWGPMQTICIPMSHLLDGDKLAIDTKEFGRIDLKITTGSAAGTSAKTRVVAEYLLKNAATKGAAPGG